MADSKQIAEWLAAVAKGDQQAFRKLYEATSPHLFALLLRILKARETAEDALQDTYVKIWQKAETYAPERGAPMSWLMSVARYRALDMLRQNRPEHGLPENPEMEAILLADDEASGPRENSETMQSLNTVAEGLESLRADQRQSLLLAYYEGLTHSEMARRMNMPLGTVKSLVRRGLKSLRKRLPADVNSEKIGKKISDTRKLRRKRPQ